MAACRGGSPTHKDNILHSSFIKDFTPLSINSRIGFLVLYVLVFAPISRMVYTCALERKIYTPFRIASLNPRTEMSLLDESKYLCSVL